MASRQTAVSVILLPTLLRSIMQAGRQAGRLPGLLSSPGETWCQLLLVSMSACSIYTHPRASPGPITPLSLVSGRSHCGPCCVMLALLVLLVFPAFLPFWISCSTSGACIPACQACLPPDNPPNPSATPGDTWIALLRSTRPAKHTGIQRRASFLTSNCTLCTLKA